MLNTIFAGLMLRKLTAVNKFTLILNQKQMFGFLHAKNTYIFLRSLFISDQLATVLKSSWFVRLHALLVFLTPPEESARWASLRSEGNFRRRRRGELHVGSLCMIWTLGKLCFYLCLTLLDESVYLLGHAPIFINHSAHKFKLFPMLSSISNNNKRKAPNNLLQSPAFDNMELTCPGLFCSSSSSSSRCCRGQQVCVEST